MVPSKGSKNGIKSFKDINVKFFQKNGRNTKKNSVHEHILPCRVAVDSPPQTTGRSRYKSTHAPALLVTVVPDGRPLPVVRSSTLPPPLLTPLLWLLHYCFRCRPPGSDLVLAFPPGPSCCFFFVVIPVQRAAAVQRTTVHKLLIDPSC